MRRRRVRAVTAPDGRGLGVAEDAGNSRFPSGMSIACSGGAPDGRGWGVGEDAGEQQIPFGNDNQKGKGNNSGKGNGRGVADG